MNLSKLTLTLSAALLLCGCPASIKYNVAPSEPTTGERARIRAAIPQSGHGRNVSLTPNSECVDVKQTGAGRVLSNMVGFEKTLNNQSLKMPESTSYDKRKYVAAEFYVLSNQPVTFSTFRLATDTTSETKVGGLIYKSGGIQNDGCGRSITFTPLANTDYELVVGKDGSCSIEFTKLAVNDEKTVATPVEYKETAICTTKESGR